MNDKLYLSIDPGLTTGLAFKIGSEYKTMVILVEDQKALYDLLYPNKQYDLVSVEQFQTANVISRYGLRTAELVGAIEALCWASGTKCVRRTPQHKEPFMNKAREFLRLKGEKVMEHQVDALAHLFSLEASKHVVV